MSSTHPSWLSGLLNSQRAFSGALLLTVLRCLLGDEPRQTGTCIKLVVQAQSQPDNIATLPLLTATFVRPVHPVA